MPTWCRYVLFLRIERLKRHPQGGELPNQRLHLSGAVF